MSFIDTSKIARRFLPFAHTNSSNHISRMVQLHLEYGRCWKFGIMFVFFCVMLVVGNILFYVLSRFFSMFASYVFLQNVANYLWINMTSNPGFKPFRFEPLPPCNI